MVYGITENQTIDSIRNFHTNNGSYAHPRLIVEGFEHTPASSPLRRYLTESAAYSCLSRNDSSDILADFTEAIGPQRQDIWPAIMALIRNRMSDTGFEMDDPDHKDDEEFHDPVSQN